MDRVCSISKEQLSDFLKKELTARKIAELTGVSRSQVSYLVRKYGLQDLYKYPKYDIFELEVVDSKEIAYMLGFIIADGYINNDTVNIQIATKDLELAELFSTILGCKYRIHDVNNPQNNVFPHINIVRKIKGLSKFISGSKKKDRNVPIISKNLEVYMIRGIFDADGCITWGYRKDRNRIWHKVSFTSSLSILTSVQKVLYKIGISTIVRPKSKEDCFVLEFANKGDIIKFYNYLYADTSFIPLKRKFDKYNALRLELGEIRETTESTTLSSATDLSVECAETTGELNGTLNNQISTQGSEMNCDIVQIGSINDKFRLSSS